MTHKNLTIKEIAQRSGVSISTVSRVLNNSPSVSNEKREKIQAVIHENDYQPSMVARSMVSKRTHTLAIIAPDINNPYFTDLISEIELIANQSNYSILLFNTMSAGNRKVETKDSIEISVFKSILEKQVDGIFILGGDIDKENLSESYLTALNHLNSIIPVVVIGQYQNGVNCHFIDRNLKYGVTLITQHLLSLGYRDIGFIGGEPKIKITTERVKAFKEILSLYSSVNEETIILNDYYAKDGYQAIKLLIEKNILPKALVAMNDQVALGAFRALNDYHLSCPEDIAIVSCDAFPDADFQTPRITNVNQHNHDLAQVALTTLLFYLDTTEILPENMSQHLPELVIRESCGSKNIGGLKL